MTKPNGTERYDMAEAVYKSLLEMREDLQSLYLTLEHAPPGCEDEEAVALLSRIDVRFSFVAGIAMGALMREPPPELTPAKEEAAKTEATQEAEPEAMTFRMDAPK